ncbi:hypothetical protein PVIIG_02906 [Plasmodium vivax India VII]|uniref:Uncharacterized protein n=1 Tax=Plasmodium vivax India VII TaxID=1077284 RepID=A0A0J9SIM0_PLAVI|nr:hypothetical protein PVIIG_02906 [Plasmodium vivax India VII]
MSAKPPPAFLKKGGPPLPKSVKPFGKPPVKPPFLLKHKGKPPAALLKGKSEETVDSAPSGRSSLSEQNAPGGEDPPKENALEIRSKAIKPKIKVPELKFKWKEGKAKVKPPPKVTPLGGKAAALSDAQSEEDSPLSEAHLVKPAKPMMKPSKLMMKPSKPMMKPAKTMVKPSQPIKSGALEFVKAPKGVKPKVSLSDLKLKGLGEKGKAEKGETGRSSIPVGLASQSGVEATGVEEAEQTEIGKGEPNDSGSLGGRDETGRIKRVMHMSKYIDSGNVVNQLRGQGGNATQVVKVKGGGGPTGSSPGDAGKGKLPPPSFAKYKEKKSNSIAKEENEEVVQKCSASFSGEVTKGGGRTLKGLPAKGLPLKGLPLKESPSKGSPPKGLPLKGLPLKGSPPNGPPPSSTANAPKEGEPNKPADTHERTHERTNERTDGPRVMVGVSDAAGKQTVVPLSTSRTSTLMQDTHYLNAFSRLDGNYVGKVTGPASPIDCSDKKPQRRGGQKDLEQMTPRGGRPPSVYPPSATVGEYPPSAAVGEYPHGGNFLPFFNYNSEVFRGGMGTGCPMFFPPGWYYLPMGTHGDSGWVGPAEVAAGQVDADRLTTYGEQTGRANERGKKKRGSRAGNPTVGGGRRQSDTLIAAGHLKPLQFREGVEWSSEEEKYLNADVTMEEERRERKKKERRGRGRGVGGSIGDSKWYEIERRLNNCRGVIQESEAEGEAEDEAEYEAGAGQEDEANPSYYTDCSEAADSCGEDTKYVDGVRSEGHYEGDTDCGEEAGGKRSLTKNGQRRNGRRRTPLEESHPFDDDSIYKNYKVGYLREGRKWANEGLRRGGGEAPFKKTPHEEVPRETPLKKTHRERLNRIAHLFLPKNKKHENAFDLSLSFSQISEGDKDDIIRMLFACRDLERLIEEQHCVLDMLENDLREVNASLKMPPSWSNFNHFEVLQESILQSEGGQGVPLNNTPFFIKGKVALIPKNLDSFFDKAAVAATKANAAKAANAANAANVAGAPPSGAYSQPEGPPSNSKYMPKFAKAKVKPKVSLLLKRGA